MGQQVKDIDSVLPVHIKGNLLIGPGEEEQLGYDYVFLSVLMIIRYLSSLGVGHYDAKRGDEFSLSVLARPAKIQILRAHVWRIARIGTSRVLKGERGRVRMNKSHRRTLA